MADAQAFFGEELLENDRRARLIAHGKDQDNYFTLKLLEVPIQLLSAKDDQ